MGPGADRYHLGGGGAPRRRRQAALAAGRCRPTGRSPLCGSAAELGRGADVRLAGAVPAVEQGLRVPASDFGAFHLPRDESYPPPEADRLMAFQTPFTGSDHGHHDQSAEPELVSVLRSRTDVPPPTVEKILSDNARRFYGIA